ncbi:OPT family small oligopeptide transporter [Candidozyma auris]|nr:OPT family small oligopeptide transporter [[Candida] auris]
METFDFIAQLVKYEHATDSDGPVSYEDENSASSREKSQGYVAEKTVKNLESAESDDIFDWELQTKTEAALIAYWSPYPEVRSVTDPFDDPDTPCETLRVYIIGVVWVVLGTFINQFFVERMPSISLSSMVVQLFVYPCGKFLELTLPAKTFKLWRWEINLNPGPWSHKEQMLATLCYSVSGGAVYATYFIYLQKLEMFYDNPKFTVGAQFLIVLSSNLLGFGFAGIIRKFVIYPVSAIWPTILPNLAVNKALVQREKKENINGWSISRYSFFLITFVVSFLYFWVPDYLFTALSTFNWISWAAPNNFNVAAITGSQSGLGLNPITTFDWNIINMSGPLYVPFFAQLNQYIGMLIGFFCIVGVWWSNYKWTGFLPINSNGIFTNTGEPYAVTAILNDEKKLDLAKYEKMGPPFYSAANLVYDLQTPVWTIFFALALNFVFLLPFAIVYAATGTQNSINVLLEMIIGYALPGNGTALNYVKTLGTNIDVQAENYFTNQKQAHYWRIAPRALFRVQMVSVIVNSLLSVGVIEVVLDSVSGFCEPHQPQKFTCPGSNTFYSSSVIWGVIGPKRVFGGLYPILQWCFLIGFVAAFPCWALKKYYGHTTIGKYLHPIVLSFGLLHYAPYNLTYYTPGFIASFFFMYVIRKRYTAWWEKYNYTLSGALQGGVAFSGIIIFFAVQYHEKYISWWGNNVNNNVLDAYAPARLNATIDAPDGYFGPRVGHFP